MVRGHVTLDGLLQKEGIMIATAVVGIGWGMVLTSFLMSVYYNMILAWVFIYFIISFRENLLWSSCRNEWNGDDCYSNLETAKCVEIYGEGWGYFNKTCWNATQLLQINQTYTGERISPAEEFFENYILNISEGFENIGGLQWKLVVALVVAWLIIFLCLIEGVKSTGKVVYFTATFPYVILLIFLIRGVTLDGAMDGIEFYITPDLTKLKDIQVWKAAATQVFYSFGAGCGGLISMSSYNQFNNNCFRDALIVCFANCVTSVSAGFAVFSIAGFMAQDLELPVSEVVKDGIGLTFIAYPEAITRMPLSPVWAVLFFFMLITLGIDSVFGMSETVTTAIKDQFTFLRKYTCLVAFFVCVISCVCGLPMCTRAGIYFFTLFCNYVGWPLMVFGLCEVFAGAWIYGLGNLIEDIRMMLGQPRHCFGHTLGPSSWYFKIVWKLMDPVYIIGLLVGVIVFHENSSYGDYVFPDYVELGGWIVSAIAVVMIPIFAIYRIICTCCEGRVSKSLIFHQF